MKTIIAKSFLFLFAFILLLSNVSAATAGDGLILLGAFVSIIFVSIFFFVLFFVVENTAFRIGFISLAIISFVTSVMFNLIVLQEEYGTFTKIIDSYSAFYYVIGTLVGVGVLVLIIFTGYKAIKLIKIKKGLLDE